MITKEIQRAGIPVVQVTNLTKIAEGIGANRIMRGNSVLHVFGDPTLPKAAEEVTTEAMKAETEEKTRPYRRLTASCSTRLSTT